jgi:hypothetical protein
VSDAPETKEVLTPVTPVTGPLFSLRAYARHRDVSATAVHRAIESGRLSACVVRDAAGKFRGITDFGLADREWAATTDLTKAPMSVILRTEELERKDAAATEAPPEAAGDEPVAASDPDRMSLSDATAREKHWKAKTAELEYKKRIGELVDAKEVEARMIDEYSECRTKLLGIARKAKAALPHLSHTDVVAIDNLVREALEVLAGPAAKGDPQVP